MVKTKKKEVQKQGLRPSQKAKAEKLLKKQAAKKAAADLLSVNENEEQTVVSATEAETQPSLSAAAEKKTRAKVAISLTKDKKIVRRAASTTTKKTTRTTAKKSTEEEQPQVKENAVEDLTTITVKNAEGDPDTIAEILIQNKIDYTPKVSVIIPVYNVELYLRECLDSVINQTLKEIEIICVDDGSTDSSLEILKEYAEKDNRITVIAPEHIGTGRCRNIALSLVKGEYIGFVDPDDWIENEYFEKLYISAMSDSDVVFQTSRIEFYPEDNNREVVIDTPKGGNDYVFRFNIIHYSAHLWSKIFKRSFVEQYNIKNSFTRRSQDLCFTFPAILLAENIKCINNAKYYYRKGHKSACTVEYTAQDAHEVFALYYQIESKVGKFNENMLSLVKYKKNITLKKMYTTSGKDVQQIIRENAKDLYETDFDLYENNGNKKIAIKNPAPDNIDKLWWGDYWLGLDLAQGLKEQGYEVRTDYAEDNVGGKSDYTMGEVCADSEINIVIRGIKRDVKLDKSKINIMYLISHPDDVTIKEAMQYDFIIVGSIRKYEYFKKYGIKAYYLPQFSNPRRFFCQKDSTFENKLLFVGNAYGGIRPAVQYAIKNELPMSLYGKFWDKYIDIKYIKGEYIDNNDLHKYYSNADIVLNDTNENMKSQGFVSNRIYDVTSCKAFVMSDYMPEIQKVYGDVIPMYRTEKEFCNLVNYYLNHPEERLKKAEQAYQITMKYYTNTIFARNLKQIIKKYSLFWRRIYILSDYILFPYNMIKLKCLKSLVSPELLVKLSTKQDVTDTQKTLKEKEIIFKKIMELIMPLRIDLKNCGDKNNNLVVSASTNRVTTPTYYTDNTGIGYVIECNKNSTIIKLNVVCDGILQMNFKGQDKRYNGCKYQFWIDYKSIKIDGKEILSTPVATWHDKPYRHKIPVKNGQEITLEIEAQYHNYTKGELVDIIEKFGKDLLEKVDLSYLTKISEICGMPTVSISTLNNETGVK